MVSTNTIFSTNGSQSSTGCGPLRAYYYFTAASPDTIQVNITAHNNGNATIKVTPPTLFNVWVI